MKHQPNQPGNLAPGPHPTTSMPKRQIPFDPLYGKARQILQANPRITNDALGDLLGIPGRSARRRIARFRGETEGHSGNPDYVRVRLLMEQRPEWGLHAIARNLGLNEESVRLHMGRWFGATSENRVTWTKSNVPTQSAKVIPGPVPETDRQLALINQLIAKLRETAPAQPAMVRTQGQKGMLEICINDLHLGKNCWEGETGRTYNPAIAETMFWSALEDLLDRSSGLRPEKVLFVVGNDFFNVDNMFGTTTAGIPQDESARWQESFILGQKLMIQAVERLRQVAPVHVLVVPGNHDTQRLWYLGEVLAAWFRNTPDVHLDHGCQPRKYVTYGRNLIGFCHGHAEAHDRLPMLMASERPTEWAVTRFREWHLGHFHAKSTKVLYAHKDLHSIVIRILPGLCPADAWHSAKGFRSNLAAEAYYWDPENGCVATFVHSAADPAPQYIKASS